jgi:hypothetical protein
MDEIYTVVDRNYDVKYISDNEYRVVVATEEVLSFVVEELVKDGKIIVKIDLR